MKFFEKRGVALVVLALAIAGAVFIGQSRKDGFIAKKPTELLDVQYQDWICDEAGLLNGQTEQLIRDYNDSWNSKYYAITAVASIDHLTGWDAEDYAANLGEKWGLGRNDMILLLVKDGDWQVYCGDNVGYTMTDTQQNQLRQAIETTYYSGDFDSAVTAFFRQADVFYAQAKLDGGDSNDSGQQRRHVHRQRGGADHRYLLGVDGAGCSAVQPLSPAVYRGRAGKRGASGVLPHFLGQTVRAAPASQSTPTPTAASRRRAATALQRWSPASHGRRSETRRTEAAPAQ